MEPGRKQTTQSILNFFSCCSINQPINWKLMKLIEWIAEEMELMSLFDGAGLPFPLINSIICFIPIAQIICW